MLTHLISALGGSGAAVALLRFVASKFVKDLESALAKINSISEQLSAISVRLEVIEKMQDELLEHDRKIIAIESRLTYDRSRILPSHDKSRMRETQIT